MCYIKNNTQKAIFKTTTKSRKNQICFLIKRYESKNLVINMKMATKY